MYEHNVFGLSQLDVQKTTCPLSNDATSTNPFHSPNVINCIVNQIMIAPTPGESSNNQGISNTLPLYPVKSDQLGIYIERPAIFYTKLDPNFISFSLYG